MRILTTSEITVTDRQRRQLNEGKLQELIESIESVGLLHPLVVSGNKLVAGERRLRAIEVLALSGKQIKFGGELLPLGCVPVVDVGTMEGAEAYEAELAENIAREDLSWQDRAVAVARLMELKKQLHAAKGLPPATYADLADEVSTNDSESGRREDVRRHVLLAAALDDPDISKAATAQKAWKVLKRKEEAKVNAAIAAEVGKVAPSSLHTVVQADCRDWLAECPSGTFDCIIIDPPYGIEADQFGDADGLLTGITHSYDDDPQETRHLIDYIMPALYRVAKEQAHLYIWCDIEHFLFIRETAKACGWRPFRTPLINLKQSGRVPWPEHGPRRCYELVFYAVKGDRPVTAIYRDVFESALERDTGGHGASKPVGAYVDLLRRTCRQGDTVLDCFAGTGTIIAAAHALKLRATAVERDPAYYGMCVKVLRGLDSEVSDAAK